MSAPEWAATASPTWPVTRNLPAASRAKGLGWIAVRITARRHRQRAGCCESVSGRALVSQSSYRSAHSRRMRSACADPRRWFRGSRRRPPCSAGIRRTSSSPTTLERSLAAPSPLAARACRSALLRREPDHDGRAGALVVGRDEDQRVGMRSGEVAAPRRRRGRTRCVSGSTAPDPSRAPACRSRRPRPSGEPVGLARERLEGVAVISSSIGWSGRP